MRPMSSVSVTFITFASILACNSVVAQDRTRVSGRVVDTASRDNVPAAVIRLVELGIESVSDSSGKFEFDNVAPGRYTLEIKHIGYGTRTQALSVANARTVQIELRLDPRAVELSDLEVVVTSTEDRARRATTGAVWAVPAEKLAYAAERGSQITSVIRQEIPSVKVTEGQFTSTETPFHTLCIEDRRSGYSLGLAQQMNGQNRPTKRLCDMIPVFLDNVRVLDAPDWLKGLQATEFERIEYLSPGEAATRVGLQAADRGVLMFYTKRGRGK